MFEDDSDWHLLYDFDKVTLQKKKEFIELVFSRQQHLVENLFSGSRQHCELTRLEKVFREQRHNIIFGLKGKYSFIQFSSYFASFF